MPISLKRINVSDKTLRPHIHYDGTPYLPGKKYLCPGGGPLKYTIQHGNYCYQLYPYQTKDWMTGKIKEILIELLSNECSDGSVQKRKLTRDFATRIRNICIYMNM